MPLHYAAFRGHEEVVRLLLDARAEMERRMLGGDTAIHQAAWQGHAGVIDSLLTRRSNINSVKDDGETALFLAAYRGHVAVCRRLVDQLVADGIEVARGIDLANKSGFTALHSAASGSPGGEEVVRLLLGARAKPEGGAEAEETPLHRAAQAGTVGVVEALVEARADLEAVASQLEERSALQFAVLEGHATVARRLVELAADPDRSARAGSAPLHLAVLREAAAPRRPNEGSVIVALAEARANLELRTRAGMLTPLQVALGPLPQSAQHRSVAVRALLDAKSDMEAKARGGERPLHIAVLGNLRMEAALLLEQRAHVDSVMDDGSTALHLAAQHGVCVCLELLLRARADVCRRNAAGQTPVDIARLCGLEQVERVLQRPLPQPGAAAAAPPGTVAAAAAATGGDAPAGAGAWPPGAAPPGGAAAWLANPADPASIAGPHPYP